HLFPEIELTNFVWKLKKVLINYNNVINTNEIMYHTYINAFITTVNKHIIQHIDKKLRLTNKIGLDESFGYGLTDYVMKVVDILVLICKAKLENMNKRFAQSSESQQIQITKEFICNFINTMEPEKKVLNYIAQILQIQAKTFGDCDDNDKDSGHSQKYQE
ncbi:415_t:CDS:2, partial [Diversispora eburnea]